ncbi:NAD(+) diphosphatase [Parabacteroides sp. OttesenSCG-928-N08]|nr:NAD(+) diphosphatase [Parabacteroides sp. OttesenSCG-928-N08]
MDNATNFYWFLFYENAILLEKSANGYTIPKSTKAPYPIGLPLKMEDYEDTPCRIAALKEQVEETDRFLLMDLRASWDLLDPTLYGRAGKASQLLYWDNHSHFCPVCGTGTEQVVPNMKSCPACGFELFPVVSTAILCLVRKGDELLLVRAHNFRGTFHGLVAGFLEPGETLEECVAREVLEETGLTIDNITYFGSQPWPYPSGLMVGYFADYKAGDIRIQEEELKEAAFYSRENLPELPRQLSLARRLIDQWLTCQQA